MLRGNLSNATLDHFFGSRDDWEAFARVPIKIHVLSLEQILTAMKGFVTEHHKLTSRFWTTVGGGGKFVGTRNWAAAQQYLRNPANHSNDSIYCNLVQLIAFDLLLYSLLREGMTYFTARIARGEQHDPFAIEGVDHFLELARPEMSSKNDADWRKDINRLTQDSGLWQAEFVPHIRTAFRVFENERLLNYMQLLRLHYGGKDPYPSWDRKERWLPGGFWPRSPVEINVKTPPSPTVTAAFKDEYLPPGEQSESLSLETPAPRRRRELSSDDPRLCLERVQFYVSELHLIPLELDEDEIFLDDRRYIVFQATAASGTSLIILVSPIFGNADYVLLDKPDWRLDAYSHKSELKKNKGPTGAYITDIPHRKGWQDVVRKVIAEN